MTLYLILGWGLAISVVAILTWVFQQIIVRNRQAEGFIPLGVLISSVLIVLVATIVVLIVGPVSLVPASVFISFVVTLLMLGVGIRLAWYIIAYLIQDQRQLLARAGIIVFLIGKLIQFSDYIDLIQKVNAVLYRTS